MKPFASLSSALGALSFVATILPANALHFYMDARGPRCFFEELPKDTVVVGHFSTAVLNLNTQTYEAAKAPIEIGITVHEIFDNDHQVLNVKTQPDGKFTFTSADSGDHKLCFKAFGAPAGGWLTGSTAQGMIRFTLDMAIGDTEEVSGDGGQIDQLVNRVKELNKGLTAIIREQAFQRGRESEFRTVSEAINKRVLRWSLIQLAVLAITCAWQLSHLRSFFIKQKIT